MGIKTNKWLTQEASISVLIVYLFLLILLFLAFITLGKIDALPNSHSLLQWDAKWYESIIQNGYSFHENIQSNAGFFPGFPLLWKTIGLGVLGISIVNLFLFLSAFYLLCKLLKASNLVALIVLSLPSIFFFYVPYSESLFYLLTVLAIIAWRKEKWWMVVLMCILLAFVRPVIFFLIPAIFMAFLLKKQWKSYWKTLLVMSALIAGTMLGFYYIGQITGDFFAYSKSQIGNWGHEFSLPAFPLTTWRGYRILWLDGLALFTVLTIIFVALKIMYQSWVKQNKSSLNTLDIISLFYTCMIFVYVFFFHPKENGLTSMLSLNRYIFCNPFLHYLLLKYLISFEWKRTHLLSIIGISVVCVVILGFPYHALVGLSYTKSILFFVGFIGFILLESSLLYKNQRFLIICLIILINLILQLYVFQGFLKGNWIG